MVGLVEWSFLDKNPLLAFVFSFLEQALLTPSLDIVVVPIFDCFGTLAMNQIVIAIEETIVFLLPSSS